MKKTKIGMLIAYIGTLILEILPFGVYMEFANPEGSPPTDTFSYFDLTPFGYANFAPFITALLTCALVIMTTVLFFKHSNVLLNAVRITNGVAIVTSVLPFLMFGVSCITVIGVLVSVLLASRLGISFVKEK